MNRNFACSVILATLCLYGCDKEKPAQSATESVATIENEKPVKAQQSLNDLYQEAMKTLFEYRALSATLYGLSEEEAGYYYSDKMEDYSPEKEKVLRARLLALSKQIESYPQKSVSKSVQENQLVMANLTRYFSGHPDFSIGYIDSWMGLSPFVVNQINGPLIDVPRYMQSDQKVNTEQDAKDYIKRLEAFDLLVNGVREKLDADVAKNWVPPKIILQGALRYFDSFLKPACFEIRKWTCLRQSCKGFTTNTLFYIY